MQPSSQAGYIYIDLNHNLPVWHTISTITIASVFYY